MISIPTNYYIILGEMPVLWAGVEVQLLSSKYILESTNYDASMIQNIKHFPTSQSNQNPI